MSLLVVLLLLMLVALASGYAGRSLVFEQRTAQNQYASTQAFEAAEAGVDWALAMLNGGRITDQCTPQPNPALPTPSFRQRYLDLSAVDGSLTILPGPAGPALTPGCVLETVAGVATWQCECPTGAAPALAVPAGDSVAPAFRVRFVPDPFRPDLVRLESNGCTTLANACLDFPSQAVAGAARATVSVLVALRSGLTVPPAAALTAGGDVDFGGAAATLVNASAAGSGLTVRSGGAINDTGLVLVGPPGTPAPDTLLPADASLAPPALAPVLPTSADRRFADVFGIPPDLYRTQPAAVRLDCAATPADCTGDGVRAAASFNPGRVLWAQGNVDIDTAGDIGAANAPIVLVVEGNLTFSAGATLHGLVYARTADWATAGTGRIDGGAIAEGDVSGNAMLSVVHDEAILQRLRLTHGSIVRVPGSWKDFP